MVSTVAAQTMDGGAKVVRIKGPARYSTGNNVWQPLKVGMVLKPGTIVQTSTEKDSYVDLVLGDGTAPLPRVASYTPSIATSTQSYQPAASQNVVRLMSNTALGIDKLTIQQTGADTVTDTQLDLRAGRILGSVKKMSAASKYEVKLPNGVAGIRGTIYDISATGVVRVLVGSVVVAIVNGDGSVTTKVVMAGQQFNPTTGEVTPISAETRAFLIPIINTLTRVVFSAPTSFTVDHTLYHVSPVNGRPTIFIGPIGGGNNNNGGGDEGEGDGGDIEFGPR